ncbi:NifU-like domain-containing protein [Haloarcula japonica DSM 6131]|uniref:NifU-like domain-containing protein n=1 Tax=Haloarcula japonica (strain ATCC 49778 / DSM 6131 / JCM 7785 / NBRC 101032 / NCIMB 13157 / TR-1) TaxID=1227453 RepID=M0LJ85_HALJT|nr:NifU family protein [Haloarcula japonica]EMA33581.1 NifU-like domain-containing protein [Haloarcula japonica DSM 6131]
MSAEGLERQARNYLSNNVSQIQQHGGNFEGRSIDESEGTATVAIDGACSGCGIAPMTMKAIEQRLPESVDGIEAVEVVRSGGSRAARIQIVTAGICPDTDRDAVYSHRTAFVVEGKSMDRPGCRQCVDGAT